ncbi:MAG TPA: hypothetical protein VM582_09750, partial [Candidatus Thermoplasmatota archaeon]|nr:hypothetical protein [Candidatus Thermoplasmatota archaeon]
MRRLFVLLLVAGLLATSMVAVAEPGKGRGRGPFATPGSFQVAERASEPGTAVGEHVSFNFSEDGISGFRASNRTLFDLRVTGEEEEEDEAEANERRGPNDRLGARGGQLRVRMANFTFTAHDAPTAASKLDTDGTVELRFAEGAVVARENGDSVRFSFGDVTGVLRGDDIALDGRNVTLRDGLLFVLDAPRGPFDRHHRDLGRAIAKGHIGAEATLNLEDDESISDAVVS